VKLNPGMAQKWKERGGMEMEREKKKISLCYSVCRLIVSIVTAPDWLD